MSLKRFHILVCILAVAGFLSVAPAGTPNAFAAGSAVQVGVLAPMTGDLSYIGAAMNAALTVGLPQMNRYLANSGAAQTLELVMKDTASDATTALAQLEALKAEGVTMVIGPLSSAEASAVLPYANANGMVLISPGSTSHSLAIQDDNLFRTVPNDRWLAKALSALMRDKGIQAVVPLYREDIWAADLRSSFGRFFREAGGVVYPGVGYDATTTDYTETVTLLNERVQTAVSEVGTGAVAVLMLSFDEASSVLKAASAFSDLGGVPWFGSDATTLNEAITTDATSAAFAVTTGFTSPAFTRADIFLPLGRTVIADRSLREEVSAELGSNAPNSAYSTWDALWLIGMTYQRANWTSDAQTLKTALQYVTRLKTGLNGFLKFDRNGDQQHADIGFYRVESADGGTSWIPYAAYNFETTAGTLRYVTNSPLPGYPAPTDKVTIGALLPLTGDLSAAAAAMKAGIEEALAQLNRHLSLNGYGVTVEVRIADTGADPAKALAELESMEADGIRVVIGPCSTEEALRVLKSDAAAKVLMISPSATATKLAVAGDTLFRFVASDENQAMGSARYLHDAGKRMVLRVARSDAWGRGLMGAMKEEVEALGDSVVPPVYYDPGTTDFSAVLAELEAQIRRWSKSYAPEEIAVYLAGFGEAIELMAQAQEPGHKLLRSVDWHGTDGLATNPELFANAASAAFALQRHFVCPIYSVTSPGHASSYSLPKIVNTQQIAEILGTEPQAYSYVASDALWMGVISLLASDWSDDPAVLAAKLPVVSNSYIGLSNFMALNSFGDRLYWDYDFSRVAKLESGYCWRNVATFHYHPTGYMTPTMTYR